MDQVKEIIKNLEKVTATGNSPSRIFDDWLDLIHTSLQAIPSIAACQRAGTPFVDPPEVQKKYEEITKRYKVTYFKYFEVAFGELLSSAEEWQDTIGQVYMNFAYPNSRTGQFFTPWNIAKLMAGMTMHDIDSQITERIKTAFNETPEGKAYLNTLNPDIVSEENILAYIRHVLPSNLPHIEPITVMDPCVGSGVMLLAAASECPRWALDLGLIQFYGVDIDPTCVKMSAVNLMLYGLNGFWLKPALDLSDNEVKALPEPYHTGYATAQTAAKLGDTAQVELIEWDLRQGQYSFLNALQPEEAAV